MRYSPEQVETTILNLLATEDSFTDSKNVDAKQAVLTMLMLDPVAPLTIPQGRQLFLADAVGNLLSSKGYQVKRQCYVRDKSEALQTFVVSVYLRYLELCGDDVIFPSNAYHGDYIFDFAATVHRQYGDKFHLISKPIMSLPGDDKNNANDFYLHMSKVLGAEYIQIISNIGVQSIIDNVQKELLDLGVDCDQWFYQHQLNQSEAIELLMLQKQNALWQQQQDQAGVLLDLEFFRQLLQAKNDLVIVFCDNKQRNTLIRMSEILQQLGCDVERLRIATVGDVELLDGGESLATSPWSDEFISLREARQEIASDRLRYDCLATHSSDAARILLSDKNKAKELEAIRIAYSKINLQLNAKQHQLDTIEIKNGIDLLSHCNNTDPRERLLQLICKYPEILCRASERWEPSEICDYLLELIHSYEGWHNAGPTDSLNIQEQNAEVVLLFAARKVLTDALQILSLPLVDQK